MICDQSEVFKTTRLIARTCCLKDAPALTALMTPDISRWVAAWPYPLTEAETAEILTENLKAANQGLTVPTVIIQQDDTQLVGWLKLENTEQHHKEYELGYRIGEQFQRRGYAFEIASAAIAFAFAKLGASRVIAGAQTENRGSHALLAKLGMQRCHERLVWAPARQRHEPCQFWQIERPETVKRDEKA